MVDQTADYCPVGGSTPPSSTKICSRCGYPKLIELFHFSNKLKGKRKSYCKDCGLIYSRRYYESNSELIKQRVAIFKIKYNTESLENLVLYLKSHPCVDCGETDILVLQFDHIVDKKFSISKMLGNCHKWEKILEEISKCQVRCANCHTRKTAHQFEWKKLLYV